jgi:hypothetical protein
MQEEKREAGESVWLVFVSVAQSPGLLRTVISPLASGEFRF